MRLPPRDPQRLQVIDGGVEIPLEISITAMRAVVEEPAIEFDHEGNAVLRVTEDQPSRGGRPHLPLR